MTSLRRHIVDRDGLPLVLHIEDGDGPVMFFQHGICGDAAQPAGVFPRDAGFRLAVLECRGHGQSPAGDIGKLSIATFAADVAAAIEQTSRGPCVVGGISMGAAIALSLGCMRPDLVSALVIARPAWLTEAGPDNMKPNLIVGQLLADPPREGEVDEFRMSETGTMLAVGAPDNLASLTGFFNRQPRAVTSALLTRISADGPGVTRSTISAIAVPTLVIGHGEDVIHPLELARETAAAIPAARLAEIPPKARDKVAYENAFRAEVRRFLEELL